MTHPTRHGNTAVPKVWEFEVELAGQAADTFEIDEVPAGSVVLLGVVEVMEVTDDPAATQTVGIDIGTFTLSADPAVEGYGTMNSTALLVTADTPVLVSVAAATGVATEGLVRFSVTILDVSDRSNPGTAPRIDT